MGLQRGVFQLPSGPGASAAPPVSERLLVLYNVSTLPLQHVGLFWGDQHVVMMFTWLGAPAASSVHRRSPHLCNVAALAPPARFFAGSPTCSASARWSAPTARGGYSK